MAAAGTSAGGGVAIASIDNNRYCQGLGAAAIAYGSSLDAVGYPDRNDLEHYDLSRSERNATHGGAARNITINFSFALPVEFRYVIVVQP